jgi:aminoglycoside phosphotransferase (APT) family kinase protein
MLAPLTAPLSSAMASWLTETLGDPGPFELVALSGGNSNETLMLSSPTGGRRVLRRPPTPPIAPGAHPIAREHRVLAALSDAGVPVPKPLALCADRSVAELPFLVMEFVEGQALTDRLPDGFLPGDGTVRDIGERVIDALAKVHRFDWREGGLEGFGRPDGFLDRQVPRWRAYFADIQVRELPMFEVLAEWLHANRPPSFRPGVMHSDFRVDNCLIRSGPPVEVTAIIDWEMATIGDPLLDVGLFLALWGPERKEPYAMPHLQAISRTAGTTTRDDLAERYARATGASMEHLSYYMTLALWKLGAIVESAYAHHVAGRLNSEYARNLEHDVPRLFEEAADHAGLIAR